MLLFLLIFKQCAESDNGSKNRKVPFSHTEKHRSVYNTSHKMTATAIFPKFEWFVYMATMVAMFEHGNASWNFGSFFQILELAMATDGEMKEKSFYCKRSLSI